MGKLIFNPYAVNHQRQWYRLFSSGLIHADWMHLFINMFVLISFGQVVEVRYSREFGDKGWYYFIMLYIGGIVISILPTYKKHREDPGYNALGASGAVSAVVFTSILLSPVSGICLYGLLCLPAIIWGVIYIVYSWWAGRTKRENVRFVGRIGRDNVNHDAHLWGAVFGFVYTILLKPGLFEIFIAQLKLLPQSF